MATSEDSLEILLNRATDPSMKEEDWDKIMAFCEKVNMELEGPLLSTRLLAHKIQSPQEKEALFALTTLEACVKNCGRYFHQEIGKFRFLNEIIKVVSPKYLGNRTTDRVKKRCIEIMYSWYRGLSHEPKICEAYQMLKTQGIIKEDPVYVTKTFVAFPPPKPRKADFEDDETSQTLDRLLRSKNPEDLQAANRLIKNMVKEDMEKMEKRSKRINELEAVRNQVKLLTEMIDQYTSSSSKDELEMMQELFDSLEKHRPSLFRLASDTDENDNVGISEILKASDSVTNIMTLYKERVVGKKPAADSGTKDSSLLDLGMEPVKQSQNSTTAAASSALLETDFKSLGLGDMSDLNGIFGSVPVQQVSTLNSSTVQHPLLSSAFSGLQTQSPQSFSFQTGFNSLPVAQPQAPVGISSYSAISHNVKQGTVAASSTDPKSGIFGSATVKNTSSVTSPLADLDILDISLQDYKLNKETFPVKTAPAKLPLNQLAANKAAAAVAAAATIPASVPSTATPQTSQNPPGLGQGSLLLPQAVGQVSPGVADRTADSDLIPLGGGGTSPQTSPGLLSLTDIFVPLDKIQPAADIPSIVAYDKNNLKVVVHFAKDRPRPDIITMVVSTISTNTSPISNFVFQAAVPKVMKVKLQPPSASDLTAYNPILPPPAITQVMLIANPSKEKVRLKYKLSYNLNGEAVSDVGDMEGISIQ